MSALYRTRQFLLALGPGLSRADDEEVRACLPPRLLTLFLRMSPAEQRHSLRVLRSLRATGPVSSDLAVAALLHDVGKTVRPLSLAERALIVIVRAASPGLARRLGAAEGTGVGIAAGSESGRASLLGWRAAFVIACHHPEWGAELARRAGASALTQSLIRRHQSPCARPRLEEDHLLARLQRADGMN